MSRFVEYPRVDAIVLAAKPPVAYRIRYTSSRSARGNRPSVNRTDEPTNVRPRGRRSFIAPVQHRAIAMEPIELELAAVARTASPSRNEECHSQVPGPSHRPMR